MINIREIEASMKVYDLLAQVMPKGIALIYTRDTNVITLIPEGEPKVYITVNEEYKHA